MKKFNINPRTINTERNYNYGLCVLEDMGEVVIAFGTTPYQLYFYDIKTYQKKRSMQITGFTWVWRIIRVSKTQIAICGSSKNILVIDFKKLTISSTLYGHTSYSYGMCNISKGFFATASQDRSVRIWDWKKATCANNINNTGATSGLISVTYLPKLKLLCFGGYPTSVFCWKKKGSSGMNFTHHKTISVPGGNVWSLTGAGKKFLIIGGKTKQLLVYNMQKEQLHHTFTNFSTEIYGLFNVPNSNYFFATGNDNYFRVFNIKTKALVKEQYLSNRLYQSALTRKGKCFVSGYNRNIQCFEVPFKMRKHKYLYEIGGGISIDDDDSDDGSDDEEEEEEEEEEDIEWDNDDKRGEMKKKKKKKKVSRRKMRLMRRNERYKFLMRCNVTDLIIATKGKSIATFKSFFWGTHDVQKNIIIDEKISINHTLFCMIYAGEKVNIPDEKLFDYYMLFKSLGMKKRVISVIKRIKHVKKIGILLFLYKRCWDKYEKIAHEKRNEEKGKKVKKNEQNNQNMDDLASYIALDDEEGEGNDGGDEEEEKDDGMEYETAFCLEIMNQFFERQDEIENKKKLLVIFKKEGLLLLMLNHIEKPFMKHKEIVKERKSKKIKNSFKNLFHISLAKLYKKKYYVNLTLVLTSGKKFKVHRELLIMKLNIFKDLISKNENFKKSEVLVPGNEYKDIDDYRIVKELLVYVYMNQIETRELDVLFKLYYVAKVNYEDDFEKLLKKKIEKVSLYWVKRKSYGMEWFLENHFMFFKDEEIIRDFIPFWSEIGTFSESKIMEKIEILKRNKEVNDMDQHISNVENMFVSLNSNFEKFEKFLEKIDPDFVKDEREKVANLEYDLPAYVTMKSASNAENKKKKKKKKKRGLIEKIFGIF